MFNTLVSFACICLYLANKVLGLLLLLLLLPNSLVADFVLPTNFEYSL